MARSVHGPRLETGDLVSEPIAHAAMNEPSRRAMTRAGKLLFKRVADLLQFSDELHTIPCCSPIGGSGIGTATTFFWLQFNSRPLNSGWDTG